MSRHRLSLIGMVGAGLVVAGALAGCATGASSPSMSEGMTSSPDAETSAPSVEVGAAWVDGGRSIAVVTTGSSSCPPVVSGQPSVAGDAVTVQLAESAQQECTRDMAPRATLVALPAGVDSSKNLAVTVTGAAQGEANLAGLATAPAAPAEFSPSAGWVDESLVAIVTYGSSTCVPSVEAVTAAGSDVAVRFATPPADQICTMDIAPRVTLADVGREAGSGAVSLVLSGGGVEASTPIPVLGTR